MFSERQQTHCRVVSNFARAMYVKLGSENIERAQLRDWTTSATQP